MENLSPETARLTVIVTVRRVAGKPPIVRVATEPDSSQVEVSRRMEEAIPLDLVRRLPAGQYRIVRSLRAGSRMTSSPPCPSDLLDQLIDSLLEPMDDLHRALRQALDFVPDEEATDWIAFDLFETAFQEMIENGTLTDARPGRFRVIVCSHPSGLDNPESVADKKGVVSSRGVLSTVEWPVLFLYDEGGLRAFLGATEDDRPFRGLIVERVRRRLDVVQKSALDCAVREAFEDLAQKADRHRSYADHLVRAFGIDRQRVEEPEEVVIYQNGGSVGEA